MSWCHRTIKHVNKKFKNEEVYYTPHEVYFNDKGVPYGFCFEPAVPHSKLEAKWIMNSYDYPSIVEVDDSTQFRKDGSENYKKWKWLVKTSDVKAYLTKTQWKIVKVKKITKGQKKVELECRS